MNIKKLFVVISISLLISACEGDGDYDDGFSDAVGKWDLALRRIDNFSNIRCNVTPPYGNEIIEFKDVDSVHFISRVRGLDEHSTKAAFGNTGAGFGLVYEEAGFHYSEFYAVVIDGDTIRGTLQPIIDELDGNGYCLFKYAISGQRVVN